MLLASTNEEVPQHKCTLGQFLLVSRPSRPWVVGALRQWEGNRLLSACQASKNRMGSSRQWRSRRWSLSQ